MILLKIFVVFARIGAITFGGGYAMVALIERELTDRGWISALEFADIVAVSQMTPGPLALNVATYVGSKVAGVPGALVASFSLALPAFLITAIALLVIRKSRRMVWARAAVRGIKGAVPGLIATSVVFFLETSVITGLPEAPYRNIKWDAVRLSIPAAGIFVLTVLAVWKFRQGPMRIIAGAAAAGVLMHIAGWMPVF